LKIVKIDLLRTPQGMRHSGTAAAWLGLLRGLSLPSL
jgi:hypothetical protein